MSDVLQFLAQNPETATAITVSISLIVIAIVLMFVVAFFQGREITFWPPKIGSKSEAKDRHQKGATGNNSASVKAGDWDMSSFFEIKPNDTCYIILNNDPRSPKTMAHGDVETLIETVKIVHELGGNVEVAPFDEKPKGVGIMTEFCIGGPDSNKRTKAHLANHFNGLRFHDYSPGNPDSIAIEFEGKKYRYEKNEDGTLKQAYAILAKFRNNELPNSRPVFLICGQTQVTNKSAISYLMQNYKKLGKEFNDKPFCLIVKPRDYKSYGYQDVVRVDNLTGLIFPEK